MFEIIVKYYELLFSRVSGNREFLFIPNPSQSKQIDNFIKLLDKRIGLSSIDEEYLFNFLSFQFERKRDQKTRFGKGVIMLNHVIGEKALDRWDRKSDNWYFHTNKFLDEYGIPKYVKVVGKKEVFNLPIAEEKVREQFYKNPLGVVYCVELTSLFHPKSKFCDGCDNKVDCQSIQRSLYPEIYNKRKFM